MSTGMLFDLGGGPSPAAPDPARPGGQRKATRKGLPQPPAPHASAVPQGAPTTTTVTAPAPATAPKLPPIDPDDASFYALGRRLLRMSPAELAAVDARHRAAGYGCEPSKDALAGAISARAPVPYAGPLVRCSCGAEMPERLIAECVARAANPAEFSLHRERLAGRAGGAT